MGQCYSVEAKFVFKNNDPTSFCNVIKEEIEKRNGKKAIFGELNPNMNDPKVCFENVTHKCSLELTDGTLCTDFDGSYGWESVMYEIFMEAAKKLDNGSYVKVWPDNGWWKIAVIDNEIIVYDNYGYEDETE